MIGALRRFIANRRTAKLEAARAEARAAFEDAVKRGDTRAMGSSYLRLRERTNRALAVR